MRTITNRTEDTALNVGNLVLGAILFLSPWVLGFRGEFYPAWNAWLCGGVIALVALLAANQAYDWEEWINFIVGCWVAISPWILAFSGMSSARWMHVAIGLAVAVLAGRELWRLYQGPEARSV